MDGYSYLLEGLFFELVVDGRDVECTINVWVNAEENHEREGTEWRVTDRVFDEESFDQDLNGYTLDDMTRKAITLKLETREAQAKLNEQLDEQTKL